MIVIPLSLLKYKRVPKVTKWTVIWYCLCLRSESRCVWWTRGSSNNWRVCIIHTRHIGSPPFSFPPASGYPETAIIMYQNYADTIVDLKDRGGARARDLPDAGPQRMPPFSQCSFQITTWTLLL
jgi:hypothetical protein